MKKKILLMLLCIMTAIMAGCNEDKKVVEAINSLLTLETFSQEQLNEVFVMYDELSDKQKEKVENYNLIEKYRDVNIDEINRMKEKIANIESMSFEEMLSVKKEYDSLKDKEKNFIDISSIEKKIELSDLERAAVAACEYVKKSLKDSSSFILDSAKVINDLDGDTKYYLVKLCYSATNSFGGRKDAESFQTINDEFENPWWGLAVLGGNYKSALECSSFIQYYLLHDEEPVELDIDKIIYYLE